MKLTMRAKMLGKKVTLISTAFVLAVSGLTAALPFVLSETAAAISNVVNIRTLNELEAAIEGQQDGQTWNVYSQAAGYGLTPNQNLEVAGQKGWYFPITASNITINGIGNPVIWGNGFTKNGSWSAQNFVTVFGDNVTIKNLTLMNKIQPNKVIEVVGDRSTVQNVSIQLNSKVDANVYNNAMSNMTSDEARQWSGSIYYNDETNYKPAPQTSHTLSNVTLNNGGVSVRSHSAAINVQNVNFVYRTNINWINEYRFYNPYGTVINGSPTYTYQVSHALNNIDSALKYIADPYSVQGSENLKLVSDLFTSKQVTLNKPNVTVDGAKAAGGVYMIRGNFTKTDNDNNSVIGIQADGVKVRNLAVDTVSHANNLHGFNIYQSNDVELNNVSAKNGNAGVNSNGSKVTINNIATENNKWYGIGIDKGGELKLGGVNTHGEVIDVKNDNKATTTFTDLANQYTILRKHTTIVKDAYALKSSVPTATMTVNGEGNGQLVSDKGADSRVNVTAASPSGASINSHWIEIKAPNGKLYYITNMNSAGASGSYLLRDAKDSQNNPLPLARKNRVVEGEYRLRFVATDINGLRNDDNPANAAAMTVTFDNTNPEVTGEVQNPVMVTNQDLPTVTVNANDTQTGIASAQYTVTRKDNGQTIIGWTSVTPNTQTAINELASKDDGVYVVTVRAFDGAGNKQSGVIAGEVIVNRKIESSVVPSSITSLTPSLSGVATFAEQSLPEGERLAASQSLVIAVGNWSEVVTTDQDGFWQIANVPMSLGSNVVTLSRADASQGPVAVAQRTITIQQVVQTSGQTVTPAANEVGAPTSQTGSFTAPAFINPGAQAVLGDTDTTIPQSSEGNPEVKGTSTLDNLAQAVDADNTDGKAMGLAWYWWLLIVAGGALVLWWIIAAIRRRQAE